MINKNIYIRTHHPGNNSPLPFFLSPKPQSCLSLTSGISLFLLGLLLLASILKRHIYVANPDVFFSFLLFFPFIHLSTLALVSAVGFTILRHNYCTPPISRAWLWSLSFWLALSRWSMSEAVETWTGPLLERICSSRCHACFPFFHGSAIHCHRCFIPY